jgi:hypothetical protein
MPRRDGEVFLLGTAISISSRDWCHQGIVRGGTAQHPNGASEMPIKAGLIDEGWP